MENKVLIIQLELHEEKKYRFETEMEKGKEKTKIICFKTRTGANELQEEAETLPSPRYRIPFFIPL